MLLSISAAPAVKQLLMIPGPRYDHSTEKTPITAVALKAFSDVVFCHLNDEVLLSKLNRAGIYKADDIIKAANASLKATRAGETSFIDKGFPALVRSVLERNFDMKYNSRAHRSVTVKDAPIRLVKDVSGSIAGAYSFVATKLCAVMSLDAKYVPAIAYYLFTGRAGNGPVPKAVTAIFSKTHAQEVAEKKRSVSIGLLDVTPALIKKHGADLVSQLPEMYDTFIEDERVNCKPQKRTTTSKVVFVAGRRIWAPSKTSTTLTLASIREQVDTKIRDTVGEEVYRFFTFVIPKFGSSKRRTDLLAFQTNNSRIYAVKRKIRTAEGKLAKATTATGRKEQKTLLDTYAGVLKTLTARSDELRGATKKVVEPWMAPYVGANVDITTTEGHTTKVKLDDGILIHRLVQRANQRKLKPDSIELGAVIDSTNAALLTIMGVDNVLLALGGSSIKLFRSVFSKCVDQMKLKVFSVAMSDQFGGSLDTAIGTVTDKRLLRLNSLTSDDEAAFKEQYASEIEAWNPLKLEVAALVERIASTTTAKESRYTVKPVSEKVLKEWQDELPQRIWGGHNAECTLVKAWSLTTTPLLAALLKNAKRSTFKVIQDVYHGTSEQSGSVILHCGFKIKGTQVTGRSMGDVLYVAPNLDKSAQYVGKANRGKVGGSRGIVFVGDIVISGEAGKGVRGTFAWTHTGAFQTEEIGLRNPNKQFVIRRVYLINMVRTGHGLTAAQRRRLKLKEATKKTNPAVAKFKKPVKFDAYAALHKV